MEPIRNEIVKRWFGDEGIFGNIREKESIVEKKRSDEIPTVPSSEELLNFLESSEVQGES